MDNEQPKTTQSSWIHYVIFGVVVFVLAWIATIIFSGSLRYPVDSQFFKPPNISNAVQDTFTSVGAAVTAGLIPLLVMVFVANKNYPPSSVKKWLRQIRLRTLQASLVTSVLPLFIWALFVFLAPSDSDPNDRFFYVGFAASIYIFLVVPVLFTLTFLVPAIVVFLHKNNRVQSLGRLLLISLVIIGVLSVSILSVLYAVHRSSCGTRFSEIFTSRDEYQGLCLGSKAAATNDPGICDLNRYVNDCYYALGVIKQDYQYCDKTSRIHSCYGQIVFATKDYSFCDDLRHTRSGNTKPPYPQACYLNDLREAGLDNIGIESTIPAGGY